KTVFMGNLSFSIEENDIVNFFKDVGEVAEDESSEEESSDDEPAKPQVVKKAAAKKDSSSDEEESSEEESSDEDEEPKTAKKNTDVEMVDAPSAKKAPQTPATPQATGSKTVFMGNLSFSIEEND
nr:nucleolin 1-like isoform X1 [Tanacetum cinerariifolium]